MLWTKNGKIIMRNGRFCEYDDCPCYCRTCHDMEKAYNSGKIVPNGETGHDDKLVDLGYRVKTYRNTNYEVFHQTFLPQLYIRFNGQKEHIDWGVGCWYCGITTQPTYHIDEDGWYFIYQENVSVFYPSEDPPTKTFDAREQAEKYGRSGCLYETVDVVNDNGTWIDLDQLNYKRGCYYDYTFRYPDCKTTNFVRDFIQYKLFDISVCTGGSAIVSLGMNWDDHITGYYFKDDEFWYSTYSDGEDDDCGGDNGAIFMDGVKYIDNYTPFPRGGWSSSGTFKFPGYRLCQGYSFEINDWRDHAGNNYNHKGTHNYHMQFYLPVIYDGSNALDNSLIDEHNSIEQEDDIQ